MRRGPVRDRHNIRHGPQSHQQPIKAAVLAEEGWGGGGNKQHHTHTSAATCTAEEIVATPSRITPMIMQALTPCSSPWHSGASYDVHTVPVTYRVHLHARGRMGGCCRPRKPWGTSQHAQGHDVRFGMNKHDPDLLPD